MSPQRRRPDRGRAGRSRRDEQPAGRFSGSGEGDERELLRRGLEALGLIGAPSAPVELGEPAAPAAPAASGKEQCGGDELIERLLGFVREVRMWNDRVRLISDPGPSLIPRHLLDSLAPLPLLREYGGLEETADAGSGNGFPALPLLICERRMRVTMIERSGKKAGFLRNATALPGVEDRARVAEEDVKQLSRRGERFSLVLARAFLPFSRAFELLDGIRRKPGGRIVYFGGRRAALEEELALLETCCRRRCELVPVDVPYLEEERHLAVVGD
jgi:16S rRNA (guanine527-N7)-methyltransferase